MAETTIRSDLIRGSIDAMLLRVLSAHDSYGYEIIKTITQRTGGRYELKEPSLYTSLKRLERDGCVQSYWGDASQGAPEVLPHYAGGRGAAARRGGAVARGAGHH